MDIKEQKSRYMRFLPLIYHKTGEEKSVFMERFLRAFEKILSGIDDDFEKESKGIEQILARIHEYFDPYKIPREFIDWLAGWVGLTLKQGEDWQGEDLYETLLPELGNNEDKNLRQTSDEKQGFKEQIAPLEKKRITLNRNLNLITQIVTLYRKRGTRQGIEKFLQIYAGKKHKGCDINTKVIEFLNPFQVGITSTVGENTVVGEAPAYYFEIHMRLPKPDPIIYKHKAQMLENVFTIIDNEKPAYTHYKVKLRIPTMQIGKHSTIKEDTMLGGVVVAKRPGNG